MASASSTTTVSTQSSLDIATLDRQCRCSRCHALRRGPDLLPFPECGHIHCMECLIEMTNTSLSLHNKKPECAVEGCAVAMTVCPPVLSQHLLQRYSSMYCGLCRGRGFSEVNLCGACQGTGQFVTSCRLCKATGIWESTRWCSSCAGSGHGHDGPHSMCSHCRGLGQLFERKQCPLCSGQRSWTAVCGLCSGQKYLWRPCRFCNRPEKIMMLELNLSELVRKQSLCIKCSQYHPNGSLTRWSGCGHTFCSQCCSSYIQRAVMATGRYPLCLVSGCRDQLLSGDPSECDLWGELSAQELERELGLEPRACTPENNCSEQE